MIKNKDLKKRIIDISYRHKLSHLGSVLTAVDIIDEIYSKRKLNEPFVLSCGHAGLALYVVLEKYYGPLIQYSRTHPNGGVKNLAEYLLEKHGIHPNRDPENGIWCSTGSLGQGLPIAVGMALADRTRNVYCLISDGELAEGSIWEAFRIASQYQLKNLFVYINRNGWAAYQDTDSYFGQFTSGNMVLRLLKNIGDVYLKLTDVNDFPFLKDQDAHYHVMNEEEYKQAMEILK